jgi:ribosomal protein L24E
VLKCGAQGCARNDFESLRDTPANLCWCSCAHADDDIPVASSAEAAKPRPTTTTVTITPNRWLSTVVAVVGVATLTVPSFADVGAAQAQVVAHASSSTCDGTFPAGTVVGMAATSDDGGYWIANSQGLVVACGDASNHGGVNGAPNRPIVGIAATPDGGGYDLVASDGGIFTFGDAAFHGSTGALELNKPVVGMATAPGGGYWLVASDGGIFAFGSAQFYGSTGALHLNKPVVGMATAPGGGYWLVASDGGIFAFGSAQLEWNQMEVARDTDLLPRTGGYSTSDLRAITAPQWECSPRPRPRASSLPESAGARVDWKDPCQRRAHATTAQQPTASSSQTQLVRRELSTPR